MTDQTHQYQQEFPPQPQQKTVNQPAQAGQDQKINILTALTEKAHRNAAEAHRQHNQFMTAENHKSALKANLEYHKRSVTLTEAILEQHEKIKNA